MATQIRPIAEFDMTFTGDLDEGEGNLHKALFKCVEHPESRNLTGSYQIVYDVFLDPHHDDLFTTDIYSDAFKDRKNIWSDEILIGWNVWRHAGWGFYDETLVKQWPPNCTRVSHNSYRVAIPYRPLFILDFETTPITTKRLSSFDVAVLNFDSNGVPSWVDISQFGQELQQALHFINVDKKGKTQGVTIIEPSFSWTERWTWGPVKSLQYREYLNELANLTATVNLDKFRGFQSLEILFRGASGRYVGPMTWEIDYRYSRRPTRKDIEVCGVVKEKNWDFRGPWNVDDLETTTKVEIEVKDERRYIVEKPDFVKVHKIFKRELFSKLLTYPNIPLGDSRIWENQELQDHPPRLGEEWLPPDVSNISNKVF